MPTRPFVWCEDERGKFATVTALHARTFTIDEQDWLLYSAHSWTVFLHYGCRYVVRSEYNKSTKKKRSLLLHREIMGEPAGLTVDHIDGDGTNNRRHNLRICTFLDNQRNYHRRVVSNTGYLGVYRVASGKFTVIVSVDRKVKYFGTYADLMEAVRMRDSIAAREYGEFATLNLPAAAD